MTPERWMQVDQLLQAALEREPAARAAFLAESCGDDDELRCEVESLLVFHERDGNFIEALPAVVAGDLLGADESRAGQTVDHYHLIREIGRGGMGEVYLALDTQLGRRVALKFLPERFTFDAHRLNRFRQEARAASALNHPNILTIFEIGEAGGMHFIAAEFVEGQTLRVLIEGGELNLGAALDIAIQSASALAAAHQAGIIHRDIKPENLMMRPDGYVKVLDFGLAKLNERTPDTNGPGIGFPTVKTESGMLMGTISYVSPEQGRGLEVDALTDIFSLGVVLHEMIAGCQPFTGLTSSDVLAAVLTAEPPPLARFVPQIPAEMQRIVSRALAKDRRERYPSAVALLDDLKHMKEELELKARLRRNDAVGADQRATLDLRLGQWIQTTANQPTQITDVKAARTTARQSSPPDRSQSSPSHVMRWIGIIAAGVFVLMLIGWGVNK